MYVYTGTYTYIHIFYRVGGHDDDAATSYISYNQHIQ